MRNSSIFAVEGIGDAAHVPPDAKGSGVEIDGQRIAHLRNTSAVQIEALVVRAGVLVVGADASLEVVAFAGAWVRAGLAAPAPAPQQ
jgi:hypothetical protein